MGTRKDVGQEPGGPSSPGSSNGSIHQQVLNRAMTGPGVSFRTIILAAVRMDCRGEAGSRRAMELSLTQAKWEGSDFFMRLLVPLPSSSQQHDFSCLVTTVGMATMELP